MNCTNKQQETCEVEKRGCNGCAYNEKTADEMFAKTKYKKQTNYKELNELKCIEYRANMSEFIKFNIIDEYLYIDGAITIQELQAIIKKVQELGWKG